MFPVIVYIRLRVLLSSKLDVDYPPVCSIKVVIRKYNHAKHDIHQV